MEIQKKYSPALFVVGLNPVVTLARVYRVTLFKMPRR
jgi:hypothetical protein